MKFYELGQVVNASECASGKRRSMKATVHRAGRLGFSREAATAMGLEEGKGLLIARNGDDWFVKVVTGRDDTNAFKLRHVSGYFSISAKGLFDVCGIDYSALDKTHIFDIEKCGEDEADNAEIWKFRYRVIDCNRKERKENAPLNEG